jgi:hypothetical protein
MPDREEIAKRHGIPQLAAKLVGDTEPELEADAAAKAAVIRMFSPRRVDEEPLEPSEPEIEGLPPKDKPIAEYTDEERQALHASFDRTMREQAKRERRERREEVERRQAEANRIDAQRHGDAISAGLAPSVKRAANEALARALHPEGEGW